MRKKGKDFCDKLCGIEGGKEIDSSGENGNTSGTLIGMIDDIKRNIDRMTNIIIEGKQCTSLKNIDVEGAILGVSTGRTLKEIKYTILGTYNELQYMLDKFETVESAIYVSTIVDNVTGTKNVFVETLFLC